MATGRIEASLAASRRCLELDPVDIVINVHLIWHYWLARQPDEAIEQGWKSQELHPTAFWPEFFMGLAYEDKCMMGQAITHFEKALAMSSGHTFVRAALGHAYGLAGERGKATATLRMLEAEADHRYVPAYDRAVIHAGLNHLDRALEYLQRAYDEHSSWISYLNVEPRLEPLRDHPRFAELAKRLRLPALR